MLTDAGSLSMSMHKLHRDSADSAYAGLDLFSTPMTETSTLEGKYVEIAPVRESRNGVIDFEFSGTEDEYLDLANTLISVQARVVKADGSRLPENAANVTVMPTNNFLHTCISALGVSVNGTETSYEPNYAHRCMLENLVNSSPDSKKGSLESCLYTDNVTAALDQAQLNGGVAADVETRKSLVAGSKIIDLLGRVHSDIFNQQRFLPANCEVRLKFLRSAPEFCLMKTDAADEEAYKVDFESVMLLLRKVKIHPSIVTSHNSLLANNSNFKFPINRVETQTFSITAGRQSEQIQLFTHRVRPKRLFFALIDHRAKNGDYALNPFKFSDYGVSSYGLLIDGHPVPNKPIRLDVASGVFTQAWTHFLISCGMFIQSDNGITRSKWANGYTIFGIDLTGDLCESTGVHLVRQGATTLELTFSRALPHTVSVFSYAEFDDLIQVSQARTVTRSTKL